MAVSVVDAFEVVEIADDDRYRLLVREGRKQRGEGIIEVAAIVQPG